MVKLVPVPKDVPPVAAAYQLIVPADAVAPKATVPVPQVELGVVPVRVDGEVLMVMFMELEVAGLPVTPVLLEVKIHVTTSLLFKVAVVYVNGAPKPELAAPVVV